MSLCKLPPKVQRLTEALTLGEGPHWDAATQSLYFVDIFGKSIHRYHPATKSHTKAIVGTGNVSLIIPVDGQKDTYLISIDRQIATVKWDGESDKVTEIKKLWEVDEDEGVRGNRINDGKTDPSGKLWAGTMGEEKTVGSVDPNKGSLFSFDKKGVTKHVTDITIANGLAWNLQLKKFYYIDSPKKTVDQFDFDPEKGTISNRQVIFSLDKHNIPGLPDGQTIDAEGNLWVAIFNGSRVIKIDPRKPETLLETIDIPAKQTTSVAFGGPNLDELYVTSAALAIDGVALAPPDHGATYKVTGLGVKGLPGVSVKI